MPVKINYKFEFKIMESSKKVIFALNNPKSSDTFNLKRKSKKIKSGGNKWAEIN
jgi:hypothetical protein